MGATAMPWYDLRAYQKPEHGFPRPRRRDGSAFRPIAGFDLKRRRGVVVLSNKKTRSQPALACDIFKTPR